MPSFDAELKARLASKGIRDKDLQVSLQPTIAATAAGDSRPPLLIVISPGPRNARTDPDSGLRFYTWMGHEYPSATTVRRMAGIPHRLAQWQLTQVINRAIGDFPELEAILSRDRKPRERNLDKNRATEAAKWLRLAATEERDASAKLGTAVHDAAAQGLDPDTVEPAVRPRLLQFRHWLSVARPEVLASECQVFNLTHGYAGTFDLLARFADGSIWLIDLKTGKGTYSEHLLQLLFYRNAEFVGTDDVIDQATTDLLHAVTGIAVLHLADDHWEFQRLEETPEAWRAARGLLAFATWMHEHPDIGDVTVATRRGSYG